MQLKRRKHGASFAHAEQALRDPIAVTVEDPDAERDRRFVTLGMDAVQAHDEIM
ncbi:MAG TPA: BrnT family toxin [Steroidobacteraceae bacterium]|nr:BrnT family toxin [Steroidobacteraceae bacterium]